MEYIVLALWGIFTGAIVMGSFGGKKQESAMVKEIVSQQVVVVTEPVVQQAPVVVVQQEPKVAEALVVTEKAEPKVETPVKETTVDAPVKEVEKTAETSQAEDSFEKRLMLNEDGTPKTHYVQRGEYLTQIAQRYLGDSRFWPYIVEVNRHMFMSPEGLKADMNIYLPSKEYFNIDAKNPESIEKAKALISNYLK